MKISVKFIIGLVVAGGIGFLIYQNAVPKCDSLYKKYKSYVSSIVMAGEGLSDVFF